MGVIAACFLSSTIETDDRGEGKDEWEVAGSSHNPNTPGATSAEQDTQKRVNAVTAARRQPTHTRSHYHPPVAWT